MAINLTSLSFTDDNKFLANLIILSKKVSNLAIILKAKIKC